MSYKLGETMGWRESLLGMALIALLGAVVYGNTLQAPFVLDDIYSIVNSEERRSLDFSPREWFGTRALPYFTLDINYAWGELSTRGYHVVNIAIHVIASWAAFWLTYLLSARVFPQKIYRLGMLRLSLHVVLGLFGGLLFLSHPMQTQAVTYIVQRIASLAVMFYLLSLTGYVMYRLDAMRWRRRVWAGLSLAAAVAAMHSKEIAATLPIAIFMLEFFFFSGSIRGVIGRLPYLVPWLVTLLIIPFYLTGVLDASNLKWLKMIARGEAEVVLELDVPPEELADGQTSYNNQVKLSHVMQFAKPVSVETQDVGRGEYLLTQFSVVPTYMRLLVVPVGQNIDHDIALARTLLAARPLVGLVVLAGVLGFGFWLWRKGRTMAAFGIFFFFLGLSVESSLVPITDVVFEHRVYIAFIGFALLLVDLLQWLLHAVEGRHWFDIPAVNLVLGGALSLVLVLGGMSYARNLVWQDELSLWSDAAAKSPQKVRPLNNLGLALMADKQLDEAEATFLRALATDPDDEEVLTNLGSLYGQQGRSSEAIDVLERAIEVRPDFTSGYVNLGNVYMQQRRYVEAALEYERALSIESNRGSLWASFGDALIGQNRTTEAIVSYQRAVAINDTQAMWFNRLGALLAQLQRYDEAESALKRAIELDPGLAVARDNLRLLERERRIN